MRDKREMQERLEKIQLCRIEEDTKLKEIYDWFKRKTGFEYSSQFISLSIVYIIEDPILELILKADMNQENIENLLQDFETKLKNSIPGSKGHFANGMTMMILEWLLN